MPLFGGELRCASEGRSVDHKLVLHLYDLEGPRLLRNVPDSCYTHILDPAKPGATPEQ
jgi:hypothetical protein